MTNRDFLNPTLLPTAEEANAILDTILTQNYSCLQAWAATLDYFGPDADLTHCFAVLTQVAKGAFDYTDYFAALHS